MFLGNESKTGGLASIFHVSQIESTPNDLLVDLLDQQAELPGVRKMRRWTHAALAMCPGENALDIGCGTGSEVIEFAARAGPAGRAVGVDPNPQTVAIAKARAVGENSAIEFIEGSAYALPFPDASFDVVRCERVFQHLDDPAAATAEIARVLRPGGRVALIDSDWHTAITHPCDQRLIELAHSARLTALPNPTSGRRLRGLLVAAGFSIVDLGAETVIWDPDRARTLITLLTQRALDMQMLGSAQVGQIMEQLEAGFVAGNYHISVTMFAVIAHKPQRSATALEAE
ncbi:methyltransferase domain-containing protein [Nocardia brasiliensis]